MNEFPASFIEMVDQACLNSEEFYKTNSRETAPNPYFIGMGNPNSKILIIGKELAFDADSSGELLKLQNESINNPYQWKEKISQNSKSLLFDPSYPYNGETHPRQGGRTWNRYQKLYENIETHLTVSEEENFHKNFFYTELNIVPSKSSRGIRDEVLTDRITFFKGNTFFQNFKVIILACGDYLSKFIKTSSEDEKIEYMFGIKKKCELGSKFRKLNIYTSKTKLGIHTRQLSSGVRNDYLKEIAGVINKYPDISNF